MGVPAGWETHKTKRAIFWRKGGRRKPLSHPDISIKCSLTLCCIEKEGQERRHSSLVNE